MNSTSKPQAATPPTPKVVAPSPKTSKAATFGLPMRLQIPTIGVAANISYMGLTPTGDMDVPPDLLTVGWYKFGTKPGEQGSAVLAGHLEGTEDLGVFAKLDRLKPGDLIEVVNDRNETVAFTIRETKSYKQTERPAEIFNRTDGRYLNLITCSGVWDNAKKRYSHRYVVFADKV
ncbi:class F sortase [Candidatus Saccharibacteria bacterium]|nr:class F sortase [Candidatus Saccharibacteria bacterium]